MCVFHWPVQPAVSTAFLWAQACPTCRTRLAGRNTGTGEEGWKMQSFRGPRCRGYSTCSS